MLVRRAGIGAGALACVLLAGCATTVAGSPTWPGEALAKASLGAADFPPGVQFDRIVEQPGQPDGADGPGPLLSRPEGCSNALTNVIATSAQRGPGSAAKYVAAYDGARIVMTLLSWNLDLDKLRAAGSRCARFEAFFSPDSQSIPITTTEISGSADSGLEPEALAYRQTMELNATTSSVYMAFQNVGGRAVFGVAFPEPNPAIPVQASLPQTFLEVFTRQIARIRST
ncbi:MAG: hypothetical protein ACKOB8_03380 [Mycobacterium sp.]